MCYSWIGSFDIKCVKLFTVPLLTVGANSLAVSTVISTTLDDWKYVFAA